MKSAKKRAFAIFSSLFSLALCMSLVLMPSMAYAASVDVRTSTDEGQTGQTGQSGTYVFDERMLFSSTEFQQLEAQAVELANQYNMGVYFLTTSKMDGYSDPTESQRTSYATKYYKNHGLGLNPDSKGYGDGIMFVVAADSRDYVTIAYGQGSYSFSDSGIEAMEDAVTGHLSDNDWFGAATTYYDQIGGQLAYYERHGSAQEPIDLTGWIVRLVIIIVIPLFITYFIIKRERDAMKTAVEQSEASHYLDESSLNVTVSNDQFVNTTLVATPKPKHNDSDSGGGWGGGGGGGFSSSGGGKF